MAHKLASVSKTVQAIVPAVVAPGAVTPVEVDARGFSRAQFFFNLGACGAGASTLDLKIQESATAGGGLADHSPAAELAQITKAAGANKCYMIDLAVNPAKPYLKVAGTVGTDTFAIAAACTLYNGTRSNPPTQAYVASSTVE